MTDKQEIFLEKLKKQLEPIINDLAKTHADGDAVRIEYPVGGVLIWFKGEQNEII